MAKPGVARPIQMADLRRRPGTLIRAVAHEGQRFIIFNNRQEMAALVRVADLDALERAGGQSTERQIEQMLVRLGGHDALRRLLQRLDGS
ncbi:Antitoxin Phd_YefM, type II toxin-antitoxin system [Lutimaribacter saemankumensis]|uniref:Antitoxin Phd_YefM, type II toxin-antitoxin system n=2 Tax=Lutimaribacter saemankumensis TaxID=490829 RepID=A0A1G8Q740_9RHOB|nr:Antitoxin Phd_YefM, type II toxin-antitoxin system [Lutimaribacter saemankumensis]